MGLWEMDMFHIPPRMNPDVENDEKGQCVQIVDMFKMVNMFKMAKFMNLFSPRMNTVEQNDCSCSKHFIFMGHVDSLWPNKSIARIAKAALTS